MTATAPVPYPKAIERFPTLSQSLLSGFDRCGLSTKFDLDAGKTTSPPLARGRIFHATVAKCLEEMAAQQEERIEVDVALAILEETIRMADVDESCYRCGTPTEHQQGEDGQALYYCPVCEKARESEMDVLPMDQIKELRMSVIKWAYDNTFSIDKLVGVEMPMSAEIAYPSAFGAVPRKLTGKVDAMFVEGDRAIVPDWKDSWALPGPTSVSFTGYFQQRYYGFLIFRNFDVVKSVVLREVYHRYNERREVLLHRDDMPDVEAELSALAERFDRAYEQGIWKASPGKHCLSADTRFLTDGGVRSLGEACGEQVRVMDRFGDWRNAEVRSFGRQPLVRVTFDDGSVVRATPDHRWWTVRRDRNGWRQTQERVTTVELDRAPVTRPSEPGIDREGVRHGFTYGDGWRRNDRQTCEARFMPHDEEIAAYFADLPAAGGKARRGAGVHRRSDGFLYVTALPGHYKDLPDRMTPAYARGFIAGLLAADGEVDQNGGVRIFCEGEERAHRIAELARIGGCAVSSVLLTSDKATNLSAVGVKTRCLMGVRIKPATAPVLKAVHRARLRAKNQMRRMYREVVSIEPDGVEEVYCAVVPGAESFTLANGIATSNCSYCSRPEACPIFPTARGEGAITSASMARRYAAEAVVAKAVLSQRTKALKAYANRHGDVPVEHDKGHSVYGYVETVSTERPEKERLEAELRRAGVDGINVDKLYKAKKGTKFVQHEPKNGEPQPAEARMEEMLRLAMDKEPKE